MDAVGFLAHTIAKLLDCGSKVYNAIFEGFSCAFNTNPADCWSMRMTLCLIIRTANAPTKMGWATNSRLATWSSDHGLNISKTKCVECLVYSKNTSSQLMFPFLNRDALSCEQTIKYLGVHFSSNMTWTTHIDTVFTKCLKLSFLFAGSLPWTFTSLFYGEALQPVLPL